MLYFLVVPRAIFRIDLIPAPIAKLELEMAFIGDLLDTIFTAFKAIAEDRGISFVVFNEGDELPGVCVHSEAVQEVISNILDNAFKYVVLGKQAKGFNKSPEVRVFLIPNAEESEDIGVTIVINDNGPRMSEADAAGPIFERGFRIEATQKKASGQGLGLSIARNLTEAMGGKIYAVYGTRLIQLRRRLGRNLLDGATMAIVFYRNPYPV